MAKEEAKGKMVALRFSPGLGTDGKLSESPFWIQMVAVGMGTVVCIVINDIMGGNWSIWRKIVVRLACLFIPLVISSALLSRPNDKNSN